MEKKLLDLKLAVCCEKIKQLAIKNGWLNVSLIQRSFALGYEESLMIVGRLERENLIRPKDKSGKYYLTAIFLEKEKIMQENKEIDISLKNVQHLLTTIDANYFAMEQAKSRLEKLYAPDFRFFDFMRQNETGLSLCIASLLNSKGKHGQGNIYYNLFVKIFCQNITWLANFVDFPYDVETEANTKDGRRIDILLSIENTGYIGIENKPWANDQENQLEDYAKHLSKISDNFNKDWVLIYLSNGDPKTPCSISESSLDKYKENHQFLRITFKQVSDWLTECLCVTKAASVRLFIDELIMFINENINGELGMAELDSVSNILLRSESNIKSAFSIAKSLDHAKSALLKKFIADMERIFNNSESDMWIKFGDGLLKDSKESMGFHIGFSPILQQRLFLNFEFGKAGCDELYWGISKTSENTKEDALVWDEICNLLGDYFNEYYKNPWWPWYSNGFQAEFFKNQNLKNWSNNDAPWLCIMDGSLAKEIHALAKFVYKLFADKNKTNLLANANA
ncbi:PD-(D/E)XK nuclease family protein [Castellaniella sp.]|uniref:PDDEXK-like family protein n=1 Tax=Castellaniella sp. TaxID=1955812 RepID=UPI002AFEA183|nr:PD-(D/E)XK nuclease family protein [Castellaniella sp.]